MNKRAPRKVIAINPKLHAKLVKIAKRNHRTITAQVELWIDVEMVY